MDSVPLVLDFRPLVIYSLGGRGRHEAMWLVMTYCSLLPSRITAHGDSRLFGAVSYSRYHKTQQYHLQLSRRKVEVEEGVVDKSQELQPDLNALRVTVPSSIKVPRAALGQFDLSNDRMLSIPRDKRFHRSRNSLKAF